MKDLTVKAVTLSFSEEEKKFMELTPQGKKLFSFSEEPSIASKILEQWLLNPKDIEQELLGFIKTNQEALNSKGFLFQAMDHTT